MQTIAVLNHKGGVGKTTSVINIGAGLHRAGKKVLLIDLDPQANLSQSLGIPEAERTIYGALKESYSIPEAITPVLPGFDVVPSTLDLSGAEIELSTKMAREYILRGLLESITGRYDYVLIDCPPSLGLLTINALTAASSILIPLQAQFLAMQGLTKMLEVIALIQKQLNKGLQIGGVFLTQYDSRKILNKQVLEALNTHFSDKVFNTKIRDNIALAEAPATSRDIFRYAPKSPGAADYEALTSEILNKITK